LIVLSFFVLKVGVLVCLFIGMFGWGYLVCLGAVVDWFWVFYLVFHGRDCCLIVGWGFLLLVAFLGGD